MSGSPLSAAASASPPEITSCITQAPNLPRGAVLQGTSSRFHQPLGPPGHITHLFLPELQFLRHKVQQSFFWTPAMMYTRIKKPTFSYSPPSNPSQVVSSSKTKILAFSKEGGRAKHTGERQDLTTSFRTEINPSLFHIENKIKVFLLSTKRGKLMPSLIFKNCFQFQRQSPLSVCLSLKKKKKLKSDLVHSKISP